MEKKHTAADLMQLQSLPLELKIRATKHRIQQWYEYWDGMVYVSFSGGKDSTVLKHIVDSMYDDVPSLFVDTGLEYPEIRRFAMSQPNVVTVRPEMRFDEVLKVHGYPVVSKEVSHGIKYARKPNTKSGEYFLKKFRGEVLNVNGEKSGFNMDKWEFLLDAPFAISSDCCNIMKKKPIKQYANKTGRKCIMGTLAQESRLRYQSWLKHGCNAFNAKEPKSQPMSFWTEQDVLQYIKKYDVPYCSVYGDIIPWDGSEQIDGQLTIFGLLEDYQGARLQTTGCSRTGCILCGFGCHLEKGPNRFQRLKETHPRQYEYCIGGGEMVDGIWQPTKDGLGLGYVLDYIGVNYE